MNIPYVFKKCTKCGEILPATEEYFHKKKTGKYGLMAHCKKCHAKHMKQWREANKEVIAEHDKQYYEANKEIILERQRRHYKQNKEIILERQRQYRETHKETEAERGRRWRETNKEYNIERHRQYYQDNKEAIAERGRRWREANKEAIAEQKKRYYEQNKEIILEQCKKYRETNKEARAEYFRQYYEANKEAIAERDKKYRQSPQGQVIGFNRRNRRRAKEQAQGRGITKEQWLECMSFFNWQCAYSGKTLTKETRSIDHIDPLNNGGENEIWNCIPMDRSLNCSKRDKEMLDWYIKQPFCTAERLLKIYKWQEYAKNKFLKK